MKRSFVEGKPLGLGGGYSRTSLQTKSGTSIVARVRQKIKGTAGDTVFFMLPDLGHCPGWLLYLTVKKVLRRSVICLAQRVA